MHNDSSLTTFAQPPGLPSRPRRQIDRDARKQRLDERVDENIARAGARIETRTDYQAVLVQGRKPNHILHLLLTVITLGLWALVWAAVAGWTGEKRALLTVDEYGTVTVKRL